MGQVLAAKLSRKWEVVLFDSDPCQLKIAAAQLGLAAVPQIEGLSGVGAVVLAVPDNAAPACARQVAQLPAPPVIINIATNVTHAQLVAAAGGARCASVKFVSHAAEMGRGEAPLIIVHHEPADLVDLACRIFAPAGIVTVGDADRVKFINTVAVEKALVAAVAIERELAAAGVADPAILSAALRVVGAGVLKAYAANDLGPFARDIVRRLKEEGEKVNGWQGC